MKRQRISQYPNVPLGKQHRDFRDVPSLCEVVLNHFKKTSLGEQEGLDKIEEQGRSKAEHAPNPTPSPEQDT